MCITRQRPLAIVAFLLIFCARAAAQSPRQMNGGSPTGHPQLADCRNNVADPSPIQEELADIDRTIRKLHQGDPLVQLAERLNRLLQSVCFRVLAASAPLPTFGSGLALQRWWESGGEYWFRGPLSGGSGGHVHLPPDARKVLSLDEHPRHLLAPLLCSRGDADCGQETNGWLVRAEEALTVGERFVAKPQASKPGSCEPLQGSTPEARYRAWRACLEKERPAWRILPPLGLFQAPSKGWLIVKGRRGHGYFCDGLAAYDLTSGAAFRVRRCSERDREAPRPIVFERGKVPVENLREAALLIFLWSEMERNVAQGPYVVRVPAGLPMNSIDPASLPKRDSVEHYTSGDAFPAWTWNVGGRIIVSGELAYAPDLKRPDAYPSWLLKIAEEGLTQGCPPVKLPPRVLADGRDASRNRSPNDAVEAADRAEVDLALALAAGASASCRLLRN